MRQIIKHSKKDTFTATPDKLPGGREDKVSGRITAGVLPMEVPAISRDMLLGIVLQSENVKFYRALIQNIPIPVAARSKVYVCGRSPAETVGSNPTGGMDVCLLWVLCTVR